MAITYSFADNIVYGTEDINDITKSLVGAGVAPFVSKESYNVSDLNALTSALVGEGVQLNGCKCTVQNAGTQDMTVFVAQGIVFFESGVRLTVDSEGYIVALPPNTAGVVYAYYNQALQTADILFATSLPENGECVQLAEISVLGELSDKREFAQSKIATLGRNLVYNAELSDIPQYLYKKDATGGKAWYAINQVNVDLSKFRYVLIFNKQMAGGKPQHGGIFDIDNNCFVFAHERVTTYDVVRYNTQKLITGANAIEYGFDILNEKLILYARCTSESVPYIKANRAFNLTFI